MPMTDLKFKEEDFGCCSPSDESKMKEVHPTLPLRDNVPEFIMNKELKDEFEIRAVVKLEEKTNREDSKGEHKRAELSFLKMEIVPKKSKLKERLSKLNNQA